MSFNLVVLLSDYFSELLLLLLLIFDSNKFHSSLNISLLKLLSLKLKFSIFIDLFSLIYFSEKLLY